MYRTMPRAVLWIVPMVLFIASTYFLAATDRARLVAPSARGDVAVSDSLLYEIGRRPGTGLGFQTALADIAWLAAIQAAGERKITLSDYDALSLRLETVTRLDPRFKVPYLLGGLILGESPEHIPNALGILAGGESRFPADWRFPFYMGYLRYFSSGDPAGGGKDIERASRIADAPPYLALLASRMLSEANDAGTALSLLVAMERQETDPRQRESIRSRIQEVIVERDIRKLEEAVKAYREQSGRVPADFRSLVDAGLMDRIPEEPNGGRYLLAQDGSVRSDKVAKRLKVFRKK